MSISGDRLAALVKDYRAALQDLGTTMQKAFEQWPVNVTRWARDLHEPLEVGDDEGTVLCNWCSFLSKTVYWPCDDYKRQDERLRELMGESDD